MEIQERQVFQFISRCVMQVFSTHFQHITWAFNFIRLPHKLLLLMCESKFHLTFFSPSRRRVYTVYKYYHLLLFTVLFILPLKVVRSRRARCVAKCIWISISYSSQLASFFYTSVLVQLRIRRKNGIISLVHLYLIYISIFLRSSLLIFLLPLSTLSN